jgi:2-hydroxy-3-keto-5-methylthiopentenyl-1-phosphate phosphatase
MPLREVITREFEPVRKPLADVVRWELENVRVRGGFRSFVERARERGWRVVIVSSGFHELIEPILEREGVEVELFANRVDARVEGWRVLWRYDDDCGECGESCKRTVAERYADGGELVYVGDGYSDRCAALASDRVFATRGLARYLDEQGVAYEYFDDFDDIARSLAS